MGGLAPHRAGTSQDEKIQVHWTGLDFFCLQAGDAGQGRVWALASAAMGRRRGGQAWVTRESGRHG
ncbi:hypothetical protein IJJ12_03120 [bacterium]|nr:hypothetical protein [bacterium]